MKKRKIINKKQMKAKFIFSPAFWGVVLVFLGCSFLVNEFVNIDIPVFTIIISALFIYLGIVLIKGKPNQKKMENLNMFGSHVLDYSDIMDDYSNIFGEARLDLSKVVITENKNIDINCIFGDFKVMLSDTLNYRIESNTVFGKTQIKEKATEGFGNLIYTPAHYDADKACLIIKSSVVFGNIQYF